jgi:hypothetical protein
MEGGASEKYERAPFPNNFRFGFAVHFSPDGTKLIVGLLERIGIEADFENRGGIVKLRRPLADCQ